MENSCIGRGELPYRQRAAINVGTYLIGTLAAEQAIEPEWILDKMVVERSLN